MNPPNAKLLPADVYIFNHEDFGPGENRNGSSEDVLALRKTFENLQCKVIEIQDPTRSVVEQEVGKLVVKNFDAHSALVIVILSHGLRKEMIGTCDQQLYSLDDDVLFPLFANKSLSGKPKILIVQACKGGMRAGLSVRRNCYDPREFIKCYSTTEGFLCYRHEANGSVYIQTLCRVMDQDALTKDFRRIIEDVNAKVAEESSKEE
ncbi:hypothetical protein KR054_008500 [Drosophila jambulina]|nr:hypothetical protein KR054_008500 [Drosophila jambulina]